MNYFIYFAVVVLCSFQISCGSKQEKENDQFVSSMIDISDSLHLYQQSDMDSAEHFLREVLSKSQHYLKHAEARDRNFYLFWLSTTSVRLAILMRVQGDYSLFDEFMDDAVGFYEKIDGEKIVSDNSNDLKVELLRLVIKTDQKRVLWMVNFEGFDEDNQVEEWLRTAQ